MRDRPTARRPRLDHAHEIPIREREPGRRDDEPHDGRLTRFEHKTPVAEQLRRRLGDRRDHVMPVQLDDVRPRARTGVGHAHGRDKATARLDVARDGQVRVLERRVGQPVSEGEPGCGRQVAHDGRTAERRVQVGVWLCAGLARQCHGKAPRRVHPPGDHAGDGRGTLLAGKEGPDDGGTPLERPGHGVRAARDEHEHHGGACRQHRLHEVALHARQIEVVAIALLPHSPPAEQPGLVANDEDRHVGRVCSPDGIRETRPLGVVDGAARSEGHLGVGQFGLQPALMPRAAPLTIAVRV